MLQAVVDKIFEGKIVTVDGVERFYETFGIAFSNAGKNELINKANQSGRVTNEVAAVTNADLNVVVFSTPDAIGVKGAYDKVVYDD